MNRGSREGVAAIHVRTYLTTPTELKRMIARAVAGGHLHRLYWFVQVKIPGSRTRRSRSEIVAASWPKDWIPVIAVGGDPEISRCWADVLLELFVQGNRGTGIEHALCLTDEATLGNADWYEWGRVWDCVCAQCGAVFESTAANEDWCGCGT